MLLHRNTISLHDDDAAMNSPLMIPLSNKMDVGDGATIDFQVINTRNTEKTTVVGTTTNSLDDLKKHPGVTMLTIAAVREPSARHKTWSAMSSSFVRAGQGCRNDLNVSRIMRTKPPWFGLYPQEEWQCMAVIPRPAGTDLKLDQSRRLVRGSLDSAGEERRLGRLVLASSLCCSSKRG